jgi:hypothetical protein
VWGWKPAKATVQMRKEDGTWRILEPVDWQMKN